MPNEYCLTLAFIYMCCFYRGKGRWKDSIKSLEPAVGKFKGGVLKLSKQDLTKVKRGRVNK